MKNINDFTRDWYGRIEDLEEELSENGYDVLEANCENVVVDGGEDEDGNDIQYILYLGGTETTIVIKEIETVTI